ncbi:MAG: hypothetical protein ABSD50_17155 [Smithella sp.]|jgi:hypothetical protein
MSLHNEQRSQLFWKTAVINRQQLSAMGEEGRKMIMEEYSWMSQAGKINKYLLAV